MHAPCLPLGVPCQGCHHGVGPGHPYHYRLAHKEQVFFSKNICSLDYMLNNCLSAVAYFYISDWFFFFPSVQWSTLIRVGGITNYNLHLTVTHYSTNKSYYIKGFHSESSSVVPWHGGPHPSVSKTRPPDLSKAGSGVYRPSVPHVPSRPASATGETPPTGWGCGAA